MKSTVHVRHIEVRDQDIKALRKGLNRAFYSQQRVIKQSNDHRWVIRDVVQPPMDLAYLVTLFVDAERKAIVEDSGTLKEVDVSEFEKVDIYFLFQDRVVFFEDPKPRTRALEAKELLSLAETLLVQNLLDADLPQIELNPPHGTRAKKWFVNKMLEAAADENVKVKAITIANLHLSQLSDDLPLFNPDYTKEEIGRRFMPHAMDNLQKSAHTAVQNGDLSHNPMVRAQLGAGTPESMTVSAPPTDGGKSETTRYTKEIPDKAKVSLRGELADRFARLQNLFRRGEFRRE